MVMMIMRSDSDYGKGDDYGECGGDGKDGDGVRMVNVGW